MMKPVQIGLIAILTAAALAAFQEVQGMEWSGSQRIVQSPGLDWFPSTSRASDGQIWLVWQSHRQGTSDLYAKVFNGDQWTPDFPIVTHSRQDATPVVALMRNGSLAVVWSSDRTGAPDIFLKTWNGTTWSPEQRITNASEDDEFPAALSARDGSLWVFWQRLDRTRGTFDLYYKVLANGVWSAETRLTTDPKQDVMPSITQATDGRVFLAWYSDRMGDPDIFYKTYTLGSWSADIRLTSTREYDKKPSIVADNTGTVWVFWTRESQQTQQMFQWDIYSKSSANGGATWTPEGPFVSSQSVSEGDPYAVQMADGRLWVFYTSDIADEDLDIYLSTSSPIGILAHNISLKGVTSSPAVVRVSEQVQVAVITENRGNFTERVTMDIFASGVLAATGEITIMPAGRVVAILLWLPTEAFLGRPTLSVQARQVPGEVMIGDNAANGASVLVVPKGDADRDARVDIVDASIVGMAFGSQPGGSNWDSDADLDADGDVDINDAAEVAWWFDWTL